MAMIPPSDSQWAVGLKDGVGLALHKDGTGGIDTRNRSGGDESGEVEEGEQKKKTSVGRHDEDTNEWKARRGRTGLRE